MLRLVPLCFVLACTHPQAPVAPQPPAPAVEQSAPKEPEPPPRNFVCERLHVEGNTKATCEPERTEPGIHTARITIDGQTVSCGLPENALSVACAPLFYSVQQPTEKKPETKPEKKKAK